MDSTRAMAHGLPRRYVHIFIYLVLLLALLLMSLSMMYSMSGTIKPSDVAILQPAVGSSAANIRIRHKHPKKTNARNHSSIRIATLNMWNSGSNVENSTEKAVLYLADLKPDIVLLQEVRNTAAAAGIQDGLSKEFKGKWSWCGQGDGTESRIISRSQTVETLDHGLEMSNGATNCMLSIHGLVIDAWSIHLDWKDIGSDALCLGVGCNLSQPLELCEANIKRMEKTRDNEIKAILAAQEKNPKSDLVIIGGDLNTPSHLDYTEDTRAYHCGVGAFDWPVSVRMEKAGFKDTYRQVYDDPAKHPGNSYSSIYKSVNWQKVEGKPQPEDRIDIIYVKSDSDVVVKAVGVVPGSKEAALIANKYQFPNHKHSPYPSDHFTVWTEVTVKL